MQGRTLTLKTGMTGDRLCGSMGNLAIQDVPGRRWYTFRPQNTCTSINSTSAPMEGAGPCAKSPDPWYTVMGALGTEWRWLCLLSLLLNLIVFFMLVTFLCIVHTRNNANFMKCLLFTFLCIENLSCRDSLVLSIDIRGSCWLIFGLIEVSASSVTLVLSSEAFTLWILLSAGSSMSCGINCERRTVSLVCFLPSRKKNGAESKSMLSFAVLRECQLEACSASLLMGAQHN